MDAILDVFNANPFNTIELTGAINIVPIQYGRLGELGVFPDAGVRNRTVGVEFKDGILNLLPTAPLGSPGTQSRREKRNLRTFEIPHIPHDDTINAHELDGVRKFGSASELEAIFEVVNDRLINMRNKHDITLEHLRMGALGGIVLDADGSVLLDLFTEFSVTEKVIDFVLGTAETDVDAKIMELKRHIEDNLLVAGSTHSGVHVLVDQSFFDKLVSHAKITEAYKHYTSVTQPLRNDVRNRFEHKGVVFEEYRGKADWIDAAGAKQVRKFIATDEGRAWPTGTNGVFNTYYAPADFIDTVNTRGLPVYASQRILDHRKGVEIHTQSNPLPICKRPQILVKVLTSD